VTLTEPCPRCAAFPDHPRYKKKKKEKGKKKKRAENGTAGYFPAGPAKVRSMPPK